MKHNTRLNKLENELKPGRKIYQILFVSSEEEARRIAEEENYEPALPGEVRFIIDKSADLRNQLWQVTAED